MPKTETTEPAVIGIAIMSGIRLRNIALARLVVGDVDVDPASSGQAQRSSASRNRR